MTPYVLALALALAAPYAASAETAAPVGGAPAEGLQVDEAAAAQHDYDPIEGFNRGVFWFNDQLDGYVLEPVAKGWDFVVPDPAKDSVTNFFRNVRFPINFGNNLFQGKIAEASGEVGRFAINTTVGVVGLFDPAAGWGLESHEEDFGQTLGYWGLGQGPYVVLPLFGPSSARDTVGLIGNIPMAVYPFFLDTIYTIGPTVVDTVNTRAQYLDEVDQAKEAAIDYYTFVRSAYLQRRAALVDDRAPAETETEVEKPNEDDLYFPEE